MRLTPLGLVVDALAVHRLTRLATADTLTTPPREWVIAWAYDRQLVRAGGNGDTLTGELLRRAREVWGDQVQWPIGLAALAEADERAPKLATLVTCRWCASVWVAAGVVALRWGAPRAWDPLARLLALSSAGTLLARLED